MWTIKNTKKSEFLLDIMKNNITTHNTHTHTHNTHTHTAIINIC
jgi:hypothetical protein